MNVSEPDPAVIYKVRETNPNRGPAAPEAAGLAHGSPKHYGREVNRSGAFYRELGLQKEVSKGRMDKLGNMKEREHVVNAMLTGALKKEREATQER